MAYRKWYPDWDDPSAGNDALCEKFSYEEFVYDDTGADAASRGETADDALRLPYRFLVPNGVNVAMDGAASRGTVPVTGGVPLVLFLHGADVTGTDNEIHLSAHDIGTMFARDDWQENHPCYIVAPQYDRGMHWANPRMMAAVMALLDEVARNYSTIDKNRIYIYGYSAGGIGALAMLKAYPAVFRKAIIICAATKAENLDALTQTPMWLFHAADDPIVPAGEYNFSGYPTGHYGSTPLYEALKDKMGDDLRYTEYEKGEMKEKYRLHPHCTWYPVSHNEAAMEWLFA